MSEEITGSCLCGAIRYVVHGEFELSGNCHCDTCKKITGAAFESFALIGCEAIEIVQGSEELKEYTISAKGKKHFCRQCGTPIYNLNTHVPGKAIVHIGSLDNPGQLTPVINFHMAKGLPWIFNLAGMKNFQAGTE